VKERTPNGEGAIEQIKYEPAVFPLPTLIAVSIPFTTTTTTTTSSTNTTNTTTNTTTTGTA